MALTSDSMKANCSTRLARRRRRGPTQSLQKVVEEGFAEALGDADGELEGRVDGSSDEGLEEGPLLN
jgi:hypothetical protein